MRFLCYALILCLSILFPVSIIAAPENTDNTSVENAMPGNIVSPETVSPPPAANEPVSNNTPVAEPLPGTAAAAPQQSPASVSADQELDSTTKKYSPQQNPELASAEQERQSVLTGLLSKLVNSYNDLNAKYVDLSVKYDKLQAEMAYAAAVSSAAAVSNAAAAKEKQSNEAAIPVEKEIVKPAPPAESVPIEANSYAAAEEIARKLRARSSNEKTSAENPASASIPVPEKQEPDAQTAVVDKNSQQYVKLKLQEDGREVEFMLDPMYVDMNFNFKRSTAAVENKIEPSLQSNVQPQQPPSTAAIQPQQQQYAPYSQPSQAPQQPQTPQQPQVQYITYQQPQSPQQQPSQMTAQQPAVQPTAAPEKQAEIQNQQPVAGDAGISSTRDILDGIYRAQKYYYDRRYNDALRAVQNSLFAKETALGYALEGSIYYTLGDMNAATRSWRSALRLNPDMEDVRAALERYGR